MKKTLIGISILSIFGGSLYLYTSDESIKKSNTVKVDVKPIEKVEKIQFEKTKENGFNDKGECVTAGSPCMMELVRESKATIQKELNRVSSEVQASIEKRKAGEIILKEMREKERIKRQQEIDLENAYMERISETTPFHGDNLRIDLAEKISFEDSKSQDFITNYRYRTPIKDDSKMDNYKIYKVSDHDSYFNYFSKNRGNIVATVPFITTYGETISVTFDENDEKCTKGRRGWVSCEDFTLIFGKSKQDNKLEMRIKNEKTHESQFIIINEYNEMILISERNKDGTQKEYKNLDWSKLN